MHLSGGAPVDPAAAATTARKPYARLKKPSARYALQRHLLGVGARELGLQLKTRRPGAREDLVADPLLRQQQFACLTPTFRALLAMHCSSLIWVFRSLPLERLNKSLQSGLRRQLGDVGLALQRGVRAHGVRMQRHLLDLAQAAAVTQPADVTQPAAVT